MGRPDYDDSTAQPLPFDGDMSGYLDAWPWASVLRVVLGRWRIEVTRRRR